MTDSALPPTADGYNQALENATGNAYSPDPSRLDPRPPPKPRRSYRYHSRLTIAETITVQWRHFKGETTQSLADEYRVGFATIHDHCADRTNRLRKVLKIVIEADQALATLEPSERGEVLTLASDLRGIKDNLAAAGHAGAKAALRLLRKAEIKAEALGQQRKGESVIDGKTGQAVMIPAETDLEIAREISGLAQSAKDAASVGLDVLRMTKEKESREPDEVPPEPIPDKLSNDVGEASAEYRKLMSGGDQ